VENLANCCPSLWYLNKQTAHRHFFLIGKGHIVPGGLCDYWWKSPFGLLRNSMRFAYSSVYGGSKYTNRLLVLIISRS